MWHFSSFLKTFYFERIVDLQEVAKMVQGSLVSHSSSFPKLLKCIWLQYNIKTRKLASLPCVYVVLCNLITCVLHVATTAVKKQNYSLAKIFLAILLDLSHLPLCSHCCQIPATTDLLTLSLILSFWGCCINEILFHFKSRWPFEIDFFRHIAKCPRDRFQLLCVAVVCWYYWVGTCDKDILWSVWPFTCCRIFWLFPIFEY